MQSPRTVARSVATSLVALLLLAGAVYATSDLVTGGRRVPGQRPDVGRAVGRRARCGQAPSPASPPSRRPAQERAVPRSPASPPSRRRALGRRTRPVSNHDSAQQGDKDEDGGRPGRRMATTPTASPNRDARHRSCARGGCQVRRRQPRRWQSARRRRAAMTEVATTRPIRSPQPMTSVLRWEPAPSATMSSDDGAGPDRPSSGRRHVAARRTGSRTEARTSPSTPEPRTMTARSSMPCSPAIAMPSADSSSARAPSVVAACARILGDRSEAEDVAQEAFVIAYRSLGLLARRRAVRGLALADRRPPRHPPRRSPQAGHVARPARGRGRPARARTGSAPRRRRTPSTPPTRVLRSERDAQRPGGRRLARRAVPRGRGAPVLRGALAAEIAEATDRPLGTVKTHLHRGLARLRRALEEHDR